MKKNLLFLVVGICCGFAPAVTLYSRSLLRGYRNPKQTTEVLRTSITLVQVHTSASYLSNIHQTLEVLRSGKTNEAIVRLEVMASVAYDNLAGAFVLADKSGLLGADRERVLEEVRDFEAYVRLRSQNVVLKPFPWDQIQGEGEQKAE
jgi:hypothetical protein